MSGSRLYPRTAFEQALERLRAPRQPKPAFEWTDHHDAAAVVLALRLLSNGPQAITTLAVAIADAFAAHTERADVSGVVQYLCFRLGMMTVNGLLIPVSGGGAQPYKVAASAFGRTVLHDALVGHLLFSKQPLETAVVSSYD